MAKYNILSQGDDLEDKKEETTQKEIHEQPEDKAASSPVLSDKQTPDEDFFSEEVFPSSPKTTPEPERTEPETFFEPENSQTEDNAMNVPPAAESDVIEELEETGVGEYPASTPRSSSQPLFAYEEDEKQEGLNYKPILIGIGAVAVVVVLFFLISNLFFSGTEEEIPVQEAETPAQKMEREQAERKQNFLAEINTNRRHKLEGVTYLTGLEQNNVKYSSILLYGNSLDFEIFVPNRDVLAKYNIKIKDSRQIEKYQIEKVDFRPGKNGGLFALYAISLKNQGNATAAASGSIQSVTPDSWAGAVLQQAGASVKNQRSISSRQENLFRVNRIEYDLRGSLQNLLKLIGRLATTNQNISIHKLTLLPADQQKMSSASYVLKLIVDFYI